MANAELMIPFLKKWEGGYVNDKDDVGGCTMSGITLNTYRHFCGADKTSQDLKNISQEEWLYTFKRGYWDKMKADEIQNQSIAELCVHMCWNSGPITTIKKIQTALHIEPDGCIGEKTLSAINAQNSKEIFDTLWNMRYDWLNKIAQKGNNQKFLKGWLNCLKDIVYKEK